MLSYPPRVALHCIALQCSAFHCILSANIIVTVELMFHSSSSFPPNPATLDDHTTSDVPSPTLTFIVNSALLSSSPILTSPLLLLPLISSSNHSSTRVLYQTSYISPHYFSSTHAINLPIFTNLHHSHHHYSF